MKRMAMILATVLFLAPFARAGDPKQDKSTTGVIVMTEVTAADLAAAELGEAPKHVSAAGSCGAPNRVSACPAAVAGCGTTAAESCRPPTRVIANIHREGGLLDHCDGRFINWLTYRPPTTGMACCAAPQSCYPPLYTFFLDHCSGGHCPGACAAHPVNQTVAPPIAKPAAKPDVIMKGVPEPIPAPKQ